MGLDVSFYKNAKFVTNEYSDDYEHLERVYNDRVFQSRLGSLKEGYYEAECVDGFRAGAYSAYNRWRNTLCETVHGISANQFWNIHGADDCDLPFAELICFSDCEGTLSPEVCKKLAADFAKYEPKLRERGDDLWDLDKWIEAFRTAGENNGFVSFH